MKNAYKLAIIYKRANWRKFLFFSNSINGHWTFQVGPIWAHCSNRVIGEPVLRIRFCAK